MAPPRNFSGFVLRFLFPLAIAAMGCTMTRSVTLQSVDVSAGIAAPPIHVTVNSQPSQFVISPRFSLPGTETVTGAVALDARTDSYQPSGGPDNFLWRIPKITGGMDIEYIISRHAAIGGGMSLSSLGGRTSAGWTAGLGLFNERENEAIRFDIGIQSVPVLYTAHTRVIEKIGSRTDTTFVSDAGEETRANLFACLTLNTTRKTWLVNVFVNAYLTKQRFMDFTPHTETTLSFTDTEMRASASQWTAGLTPGLFIDVMEDVRLVVGERFIFPFDISNQKPYPLLQFHLQLDVVM